MLEYKVCFYISYRWGYLYNRFKDELVLPRAHNGKLHYCGHTLEDAVRKVRNYVARLEVNGNGTCTSMYIMRGREKGKNITWKSYHKKPETKKLWLEVLTEVIRRKYQDTERAQQARVHFVGNEVRASW